MLPGFSHYHGFSLLLQLTDGLQSGILVGKLEKLAENHLPCPPVVQKLE